MTLDRLMKMKKGKRIGPREAFSRGV